VIESEELDQDIISDLGNSDDESVADIYTRSATDRSSPGELNIGMLIEDLSSEQLELRAEILDHFSSGCERVQLPTVKNCAKLKRTVFDVNAAVRSFYSNNTSVRKNLKF